MIPIKQIFIVGNLTRDPELRVTTTGRAVCNFTVAVNNSKRQNTDGSPAVADFFSVTAFDKIAENCSKYLAKGRKVAVVGTPGLHTYTGNDGQFHASLDVSAHSVEFMSPSGFGPDTGVPQPAQAYAPAPSSGFVEVNDGELPF